MIHVIFEIIRGVLGLAALLLITQVVLSWLISFQIVSGGVVVQIYRGLARLTDPLLKPIRRLIPPVSGIDLSIMVLLFVIWILQGPVSYWLEGLFYGGSVF